MTRNRLNCEAVDRSIPQKHFFNLVNPPSFRLPRPALIKELEAAETEVTRLYARSEELDKIGK
ncbi:MAG: hypothetical protein ABSA12_12135 [Verrucomicrobiia bacterium]